MLSSPHFLITATAVLLLNAPAAAQEVNGKAELDRASLTPSAERLSRTIQDAVQDAGGNLEQQNAHWVFAFSTGHYKGDPLGAQAAREFVTQVVNQNVVAGDRVSARAWELEVWPHKQAANAGIEIGEDVRTDKAATANLWPTTPAVGSIGGHDTERTATQLAEEFKRDSGTVLVLVTNTAASVGAPGGKLLGANAPEYQAFLNDWTRVTGDGTRDGATQVVPYVVKTPGGDLQGQLETVVFVPKTFTAASMTSPARSERLASEAAPLKTAGGGSGGAGVLFGILGVAALAGGGYAATRFLSGSRARGVMRVEGQSFNLADFPNNRVLCVLAGPGYQGEDDVPVVTVPGAPNMKFAELVRVGNDVRVKSTGDDFELKEVDGNVVTGPTTLKLRPEVPDHTLEFSGEVRTTSGVPRSVTKIVTVALTQGEV